MLTETELAHKDSLEQTRQQSVSRALKEVKKARDLAKLATPIGALSLARYLDPFDMPFIGIALSVAIVKDVFDIAGFGAIPGIGFIFAVMASSVVAICLFLLGASRGMIKANRQTGVVLKKFLSGSSSARYALLFAGTVFESLPVLDYFPVETAIVIMTLIMVLSERRERARQARQLEAQTAFA